MSILLLALIIGGAFGFALDRVGAANPNYIIGMLRQSNLHLMKTILLAIGVSSLLLFSGLLAGIIEPGHLSVKAAYAGVFTGGILLGSGYTISGYCPGTGLAAMATGRLDALFFIIGGLAGAAAYRWPFPWVESTGILRDMAGGKTTLGAISSTDYPALFSGMPGEVIGIVMGVLFIVIAAMLPSRLRTEKMPATPHAHTSR